MNHTKPLKVSLVLMNFDEKHDKITQILGVQPTEIRSKDKPFPEGTFINNNLWILESSIESLDVEVHINDLISRVPKYNDLNGQIQNWTAIFQCMMELKSEYQPIVHLSEYTINKMSKMKCSFDIDYYLVT